MANVNSITIIGRLTKEPESRPVGSGVVCRLSVAVNAEWKDASGERKSDVTYFDVDVWGRSAEAAQQILRKGAMVYVRGEMRSRKDEQNRVWWSIRAENWQVLGEKQQQATERKEYSPRPKPNQPEHHTEYEDGELPF